MPQVEMSNSQKVESAQFNLVIIFLSRIFTCSKRSVYTMSQRSWSSDAVHETSRKTQSWRARTTKPASFQTCPCRSTTFLLSTILTLVHYKGCVKIHSQSNHGEVLASEDVARLQWKQNFAQLVDISERNLLIAKASFLQTLQNLTAEWDISALSMFHCDLDTGSLPISLAEFCSIQETHLIDTTDVIRSDWIYKVKHSGISVLQFYRILHFVRFSAKVMSMMEGLNSKGRISVDSSASIPQVNGVVSEDVSRLAKMISLMMSNQLKSSVLLSISEWETFWANYSTSLQNSTL